MRTLNSTALTRLSAYAEGFAGAFRRRDQARWIGAYLQGLLSPAERKNVEMLAAHIQLPADHSVKDLAQALQNFLNQSPWDERHLWQRYRAWLTEHFASPPGALVIDDVGFPKHGQHSVGVQRQYCSGLGRKMNCQLAVAIAHAGPGCAVPLQLRLYLPRAWLSNPGRLDGAGVPLDSRGGQSKAQIALELLDEIGTGFFTADVVVAAGIYGSAPDLRSGLAQRRLKYLLGVPADFAVRVDHLKSLVAVNELPQESGADRWTDDRARGRIEYQWRRVKVPAEAFSGSDDEASLGLLTERCGAGPAIHALSNLPADTPCETAALLWQHRRNTADLYCQLREELGLDQFEGRSWRGFHHHACLVMLAYGFLLSERSRSPEPAVIDASQWEVVPCL
jgi:SRSO17 transposase